MDNNPEVGGSAGRFVHGASGGTISPRIERFRELHVSGCFVLPNPWDAGSAIFLQHLGFKALATTSAGLAFTRARPDTPKALPLELVLAHVRDLAAATPLPLNVDFQAGYADDVETLAKHVRECVLTGAAGLSIEDATGEPGAPLYERAHAIDRVRAARGAIDATGIPAVLTARCEAWLVRDPQAEKTALDRLEAFAEAGADCLYAPGVNQAESIAAIVKAASPLPVNVLMSSNVPGLTVARLADLGVRRISLGSALARVAWGSFMRAARSISESGAFDALADAAPFGELNALFAAQATKLG